MSENLDKYQLLIIKLITGENIIGFISHEEGKYIVKYPKTFFIEYDEDSLESESYLIDYLDSEFFEINEVVFKEDKIIFDSIPNVKFSHRFLQSLIEENLDQNSQIYSQVKETLKFIDDLDNKNTYH